MIDRPHVGIGIAPESRNFPVPESRLPEFLESKNCCNLWETFGDIGEKVVVLHAYFDNWKPSKHSTGRFWETCLSFSDFTRAAESDLSVVTSPDFLKCLLPISPRFLAFTPPPVPNNRNWELSMIYACSVSIPSYEYLIFYSFSVFCSLSFPTCSLAVSRLLFCTF